MKKRIQIIHAPINLGLSKYPDGRERGCDKLPDALEKLGFHSSIGAEITRLSRPVNPKKAIYDDGALNGNQIASFSTELADAVGGVLNNSAFPIVLGGDCSVLVGSSLALARRGKYGLIHIDAHPDYYHKGNRDRAVVAGMDLAIVTGKGTDILTNLENRKPYIRSDHSLTFGFRESDPEQEIIEELNRDGITSLSSDYLIREGKKKTAAAIDDFINRNEVDGFWLHLDADVLDAAIMPSVDCSETNGLQWNELIYILKTLFMSHKLAGMNVTILDPDLDPSQNVTKSFADMMIEVLRPDKGDSV
ncbi:arginase family protein [Virgibacillus salexigens]|uniref:arginase family protein n=1 Tax=Virgibacillus salexigens TaxID=61016 RepID=UPI00190E2026|nr:arginase family protein [Virgibacillus salexigens]